MYIHIEDVYEAKVNLVFSIWDHEIDILFNALINKNGVYDTTNNDSVKITRFGYVSLANANSWNRKCIQMNWLIYASKHREYYNGNKNLRNFCPKKE